MNENEKLRTERLENYMKDREIREKIEWRINKLTSKNKRIPCILCSQEAVASGFFLLDKKENNNFNVPENKERIYIYFACEEHINDDSLPLIEEVFKKPVTNFSYLDV